MPSDWTRRATVFGGCAAVVVVVQNTPRLMDAWDSSFDFVPLDSPQGFRMIAGNGSSSGNLGSLFAGIGQPDPEHVRDDQIVRDNLCDVLFNEGDGVPVAAFSDYYCPYCITLDAQVKALEDEGLITIRHHETPLFGPPSEWAARGAIAARAQGQGRAYFDKMLGNPVRANPPYLRQVAEELGFDVPLFIADMVSENTDAVLREAASLQRIFGFIGTPSLVVGRTVLHGAISDTNLRQLIRIEREHASQTSCA